jgi:hypothetical protein
MIAVKIFSYDLDTLIDLCARRAAFMVPTLVAEGVKGAEDYQAAGGRQRHRPSHAAYYRDRNPVVRAKGPASGDMKVNAIEHATYKKWTDIGFLSPLW